MSEIMMNNVDRVLKEFSVCQNPVAKILESSAYWIPLQFVYVEMVKSKDLVRLSDLPRQEKERLWDYVKLKDWPQWKKITLMQSIYVFEYLNKERI